MTELTTDQTRRAIVEHTRRLADAAATAGPGAAVPTAPDWTMSELVAHLGQTQHWVAQIVEGRVTDPSQLPTEMPELPADPRDWPAWLAESSQRVADAFTDEAMDAPVWNAAADERTGAQFWISSSLNEAVVHGFDGANAAGHPYPVAPDVAAALITNHLKMLTSPTWAMMRSESAQAIRGSGETLQWQATDGPDAWFVERHPDGATWQPGSHKADVTVTGPAGALLLVLTRRIPLAEAPEVTVDGDVTLAQQWLDNTAHIAG
ncbi:maleylpyruvate isomerase family mycothiol-dependent enzyme [Actinoplanes sp. LDG1-06]|uniref:Maleylpyruvate isomerase family mycothiol-dependent enzyme n=1 Tax=Paractinoplanes ovalisporus TaxID=2810368 RepID=A0ABS2AST3_9ACTN|nr:maleylpyruvate isomerase family mycothiol-dependent enzyme [Actinoplanes ovalisporus]MBM2622788.1 maleylpyruvate isomerase family mycothiol-dependent enzyme [Actinoplanes ovalisporus]